MFAMTLYKCITALRREAVDNVADIWELFLRDGIVWFIAVFRASLVRLGAVDVMLTAENSCSVRGAPDLGDAQGDAETAPGCVRAVYLFFQFTSLNCVFAGPVVYAH